jgi:flagellar biosynthesis protein FlhB
MADKTEAPTPHRLQEAREEGQVVRSQELITAVVILTSIV